MSDYNTPDPGKHAVITGSFAGPVATPSPKVPHDTVDVTAPVLYFDSQETAVAVADAIEAHAYAFGEHPIQAQCAEIAAQPDVTAEEKKQHKRLHSEVAKRVGA